MAEDLKLSVVIEAILNAQGFEEAKKNLGSLAGEASKAAPAVKGFNDRITGARGPVADLTRVILINVGAMRGAGEAAKFAGVGLAALNAGAIGASLPIIGLTAAIAIIVPLVTEWMNSQKDLNEQQEKLRDRLLENLELANRWVETVPNASAATRIWADALNQLEFEKTTKQLHEMRAELDKLTTEALARGETFKSPEILALEAQIEKIHEARREGLTVGDQFKRDGEDAKRGAAITAENLKHVNEALREHFKVVNAIRDFNDEAARDQERTVRKGIDPERTSEQRRKALEKEAEGIIAYQGVLRDQMRMEEDLAFAKVTTTNQTIAAYGQAAAALSSLFGKNKAIAIAGAIADTYAAANQVLKDPSLLGTPYLRWALAAAAIATGLANVNAIRSANPVGFDDPFADLTARKLGRKSAVDFVANFGQGFHSGMNMAMGGGVTNNHTTINRGISINGGVTVPGFMGAGKTEFFKHFNRELNKVGARTERRTTLGR